MKPAAFSNDEFGKRGGSSFTSTSRRRHVVVCVNALHNPDGVISYALMTAKALGADLTLLHVIDTNLPSRPAPFDPIASDLLRRETGIRIEELARKCRGKLEVVNTAVLEGRPSEQICLWAQNHMVDVIIISTHKEITDCGCEPGDTVRRVLGRAAGAVLLVPDDIPVSKTETCRRIMAPLDGSSRAETALPLALQLARSLSAELILAHAVPEPEFTDIRQREPEDEELRQRIMHRNEEVARKYLKHIQTRLADHSASVNTVILAGGDARRLLCRAILDKGVDMVVMSSHGRSGHAGTMAGSVASHFIAHANVPLFIVRDQVNETSLPVGEIMMAEGFRFPHSHVA